MGNTMHNKIQLGRASPLASRRVQAGLIASGVLGAAIALLCLLMAVLR